jgi:glyoxylase-like metal-dependent hydrolase (beta-lactamase superfamily II)
MIISLAILIPAVIVLLFVYRNEILLAIYTWTLHGRYFLADKPRVAKGVKWSDDWFTIQFIDDNTIAIGEPRHYQQNYNYLIVGESLAILFDTGPGVRDITNVVESLTPLPVIAVPSHLHYDHTGNLTRFKRVALPDLPILREGITNGFFLPTDKQHHGKRENIPQPKFRVTEWWQPGEIVDLGMRKLQVIHAPGHAAECIVLFDPDRNQLFTGDFINIGELYAFLPESNLKDYLDTTDKLLSLINEKTLLLTAHNDAHEVQSAPLLAYQDLVDLKKALQGIKNKTLSGHGFYPRCYTVNQRVTLLTDFPWLAR